MLSENEKVAFEEWYAKDNGFLAVHCACWPRTSWPWFQDIFADNLQDSYIAHESPDTEATAIMEEDAADHEAAILNGEVTPSLTMVEEYYIFGQSPRGIEGVEITYVLDPDSRNPAVVSFADVIEAEMSWFREYNGGRSYWTYYGHDATIFQNEQMKAHWLGAMRMAAGYDIVGCMDQSYPTPMPVLVLKSTPPKDQILE